MSKTKLFCFPYAGGSAVMYEKWMEYVDNNIEVIPIELAGRGKRVNEPLYNNVTELIDDVFVLVSCQISDDNYAIFGHSLGAMISYELCQRFVENDMLLPKHVFFSGRGAPHTTNPEETKFHLLGDDEFRERVIALGGTPKDFFEHQELLNLFLPMLRNDFKLAETKVISENIKQFNFNITVLFGKNELLTLEQFVGWKKHTNMLCTMHFFEGGHFFVNDETEQVINIINNTLVN